MLASYLFPNENQKSVRMCRMQITKQTVLFVYDYTGREIYAD